MKQKQSKIWKSEIEQWIRRFRERIEKLLNSPIQVILFGSYARGNETEGSDVDLLVVVPKLDKGTLDLLLEVAWEVSYEAGVVFSVIPVAVEELEKLAESPFLQKVQREGIRL
jgi:predicted nucleotidyltransferase